MRQTEVIIVGGGPAGAACAGQLKKHGIDCLVLDQATFPRFKPCAGWLSPEAVGYIDLKNANYPHGFTTIPGFQIAVRGLRFAMRTPQYAIRRIEFDDWLLRSSGAPVIQHAVKSIVQEGERYILDGEFAGRYLVGAGGTYCPVYRSLFKEDSPKDRKALIAAQEEEFEYPYSDAECWLWFLENNLPGYAWYVPKANGVVNVGVGGLADGLHAGGDSLKRHWNLLIEKLDRLGLVRGHDYKPSAHSYYLRRERGEIRKGGAFLVGDAAGLATADMGEGIGPAMRSGQLAADAIATGSEYTVKGIPRNSIWAMLGKARLGFAPAKTRLP